jgi:hypothetical protein
MTPRVTQYVISSVPAARLCGQLGVAATPNVPSSRNLHRVAILIVKSKIMALVI